MMERRRLVSVIVPTRDRPFLLRKALASIRRLEGPDLAFEILVGDNGAGPEAKSIAAEFGAKHLPTSRPGPAPPRNVGLRAATGEFVAFLDDDDEWLPGNVRPHLALLDANPDIAAVFGQIVYVTEDLKPLGEPWPAQWPGDDKLLRAMLSGYYPQIGATVARASVSTSIGLMDETLTAGEDWDWQLRIARSHRIGFVKKPCVYSRTRPEGSFDDIQAMRAWFSAKIFARHALANLKCWPSPLAFARSYVGVITHIYDYFLAAVFARIRTGDRRGARRALYHVVRLNPVRALKMLRSPEFRSAVTNALVGGNVGSSAAGKKQDEPGRFTGP
jgi:glycosyltransferase involved in cell wall biosynthesis